MFAPRQLMGLVIIYPHRTLLSFLRYSYFRNLLKLGPALGTHNE